MLRFLVTGHFFSTLKHGHHFKVVSDTSRHESRECRLVPIRVTLTQKPIKRKHLPELYLS